MSTLLTAEERQAMRAVMHPVSFKYAVNMLSRALDDIDALERERDTLLVDLAHAVGERDEARAESARRLALLKELQFVCGVEDYECPVCFSNAYHAKRHNPDCALAAELAQEPVK